MSEVRVSNGIISFDGRVVEAFGFKRAESLRVHVGHITGVELKRQRLIGTLVEFQGDGPTGMLLDADVEDHQLPALEDLLEEVRGAAAAARGGSQ